MIKANPGVDWKNTELPKFSARCSFNNVKFLPGEGAEEFSGLNILSWDDNRLLVQFDGDDCEILAGEQLAEVVPGAECPFCGQSNYFYFEDADKSSNKCKHLIGFRDFANNCDVFYRDLYAKYIDTARGQGHDTSDMAAVLNLRFPLVQTVISRDQYWIGDTSLVAYAMYFADDASLGLAS